MPSPSPPWSPRREPQGRYEELAPMDEYGLIAPGASTGDLSDRASVDDDAVHHDDHGGSGWAQTPAWNICLNAAMYCAVPLSMPATLAAGGWFWGTVFFTYCTCATYWTGLIIGRVYLEHRGRLATYPAMAAEAFASLTLEHTGDTRIANDVRVHARRCVEVIQFATFYLDTVTQIVYVAQYFGQLDRGWVTGESARRARTCQWAWVLAVWAVSTPVMQIPSFHASRWVIGPAIAVLGLSVLFFLWEIGVEVRPWECQPGPSFGGVTARSGEFIFTCGQLE
jgi:hypothetical protein